MSEIAVNNSQNVNIIFNGSSIGERILAFLIDMAIKIAYLFVMYIILFEIMRLDSLLSSLDSWSSGAIAILILFPTFIYSLVCESLMEGQTIGKRILKMRVVKIDGYQANFGDYLIRWIFRLVDILIMSGVVGVLFIIISKNDQRLGGIASGTTVISLKNKINISHTILEYVEKDYKPLFPQVVALSDNDVRIIKENFFKARALNDKKMIQKLCIKISEVTGIDLEALEMNSHQTFIKTILKDYNYYTGKEN